LHVHRQYLCTIVAAARLVAWHYHAVFNAW
jgi:hypothetical protein